ncbi:Tumor necrosis factor receptor superfamily member 13B [Apaloderma vittatum]|uniref:Tumor necrosis factor receptor superfamily member 13B n=1 Tax=Apaloderma vittatum TaxID=57397 RepID=A0A091NU32_APAVI|nr:Tumor necrosis factor receptor superfamily member 13B [Apaloderma vittatum]
MNNCTDQQYWDTLVGQCIPCSLVCGSSTVRRCAVLCESMDCNKRAGFYYDELVRNCVNCSRVCGQHPKQCAPTCESEAAGEGGRGHVGNCSGLYPEAKLWGRKVPKANPFPNQTSQPRESQGFHGNCSNWGCSGATCCLLTRAVCSFQEVTTRPVGSIISQHRTPKFQVWRQRGFTSLCLRRKDKERKISPPRVAGQDRLVEAGSVGDGSTGSRVPEPVETCGFCFPGHASAVPETKSCHSTSCHIWERAVPCHTGICSTRSAGAMPSPDDGHFKIICSPSQEKTPMV